MGCCFSIGVEVIGLSCLLSSSSSSLPDSSSVALLLHDTGGLTWWVLGKSPSLPNLGTSCDPVSNAVAGCSDEGDSSKGAISTRNR